jgi:alkaline phosphatase
MPSRIRNKLIFLTCLLFFALGGALVYRYWVVQKPFAVILFVADNLNSSTLAAARLVTGGTDHRFGLETLPHLGLAAPRARDYAVADAAAAASTLATGHTVNRGALSTTPEGLILETLLDHARRQGRATGLVANSPLSNPATAAFFAPGFDPQETDRLTAHLLDHAPFELLLGGGGRQFVPAAQGGERQDGRDLLLEARQLGYDIVRTREELENTPGWRSPQVFGVFADGDLAWAEEASRFPSQPSLADLVRRAIELLQYNRRGYFLVVHAGLTSRAAGQTRGEALLREIAALDEAIATARRYAGSSTLLVVAGLANTGGLRLNAFSFAPDRGIAVLGPSAAGVPALTWATGPGDEEGNSELVATRTLLPVAVADDALILSEGPGTDTLTGFTDLTALHTALLRGL